MRRSPLLALLAVVVLLGVPRTIARAGDKLEEALRAAAPSLPYFVAEKSSLGPRGGSYAVEGPAAAGASEYPAADEKPPHMAFGANWKVDVNYGGKPYTEAARAEAVKRSLPKGGKEGEFGANSWFVSSSIQGTNDPNVSGDPYMGNAQGYLVADCALLHVNVTLGIYSHASHGARNKPAVVEAIKRSAEKHLRTLMGRLMAVLRFACSGAVDEPPPTETLSAEPECGTVTLVRGKLPSVPCGIYVKNWPANRAVSTCFPDLIDAWGLLPNGVVVTFRNEYFHVGAVVPKGRAQGEYYLSMWWYAQCQAVPGIHMVDIRILEGGPVGTIGGCPSSSNQTTVRMRIEVLEERSGNCDMRSNGGGGGMGAGGGGGGGGGGTGGGGTGIGGGGGGGNGPAGPFVGTIRTNFGDLVLTDAGGGNVRGTLGTSGAVVTGKVKDNEFIGEFADANGDGKIHLVSPDGTSVLGEWKRGRGPDEGKSGRIDGKLDPSVTGPGTGGGTGGGGGLPGGGTGGGTGEPGGPGTSTLPPLRPTPAPLTGLTLQAPELRLTPGQEVLVSVWLLNAVDVVNMNWELAYDASVVAGVGGAQGVAKGNLLTEAFEANSGESGRVRMGFAQKKAINGTGTVSVHRVKAVGAVGTRTPLTVSVSIASDSRPQRLAVALLHGFIEIVAPGTGTPGSTGGGDLTLQDAYNALKMSVGLLPTNLNVDVDRDGKVTSLDAWLIMTRVFLTMKGGK